jgi:hypothetical protein
VGAPSEVEGNFDCSGNKLKDLNGAPRVVSDDFNCADNQLVSLEGAPTQVGGNFICCGNPGKFTKAQVKKVCDVGGEIIVK